MAHGILDGRAVYTRKPGWHGLGTTFQNAPNEAELSAALGADREVRTVPLYCRGFDGSEIAVSEMVAKLEFHPEHSGGKLVCVSGPETGTIQTSDIIEMFRPYFTSGAAEVESAGVLFGGRKVWMLARLLGAAAEVRPGDSIAPYLLFSTSRDNSAAASVGTTFVRVECANLLRAAEGSAQSVLRKFSHRGTDAEVKAKTQTALADIQLAQGKFGDFITSARIMAEVKAKTDDVREYFASVFGMDANPTERPKQSQSKLAELLSIYSDGSSGVGLGGGTWWDAYNAVSDRVTHSESRTAETRFDSALYGRGAGILAEAYKLAFDFASVA